MKVVWGAKYLYLELSDFFLVTWEMNQSAGQTAKWFSEDVFVPHSDYPTPSWTKK